MRIGRRNNTQLNRVKTYALFFLKTHQQCRTLEVCRVHTASPKHTAIANSARCAFSSNLRSLPYRHR